MIGYKLVLVGTLLSVAKKEQKTYDSKVTPEHTILNFVDVDEEGNMKPIKVKCFFIHSFKAKDKVSLEVSLSSMDSTVFYRGVSIEKAL